MLKQKKGFTLVELLTIICVIGLILGIAIPSTNKILRNAKENKFTADSRTILSSVESYVTENNYKIPDEGIALEYLDLDLKSLNGYTGVVKYDGNNVYLDSITNNELCGAGNKSNFEVYGDLSNCRIIAEDNGECFEFANGEITKFKSSCAGNVVIPTRINGEEVKKIGDGAFVKDYDHLVVEILLFANGEQKYVYDTLESAKASSVDFGFGIPVTGTENMKKLCYRNFEDEEFDLKSIDYINTEYAYCDIQSDQMWDLYVEPHDIASIDLSKAHYLEEIGDLAFFNTPASKVTFGNLDMLSKIGNSAFFYTSLTGDLDLSKLDSLTDIGGTAFAYNKFNEIKLPPNLLNVKFASFSNNRATNIVLNDKIEKIGTGSFSVNNITSINLPATVKEFGMSAFAGNSFLNDINISDLSIDKLPYGVFQYTGLENITLPSTLKEIDAEAFSNSKLKSIEFNEGLETIGDYAFYNNMLTQINLPDSIKNLGVASFTTNKTTGNNAFIYQITDGVEDNTIINSYAGSAAAVTIPSQVLTVGDYAFSNVNLTSLNLSNVKHIGDYSFYGVFLEAKGATVNLSNVETLGHASFMWAVIKSNSLTTLTKVTEIPDHAFYANSMSTLTLPNNILSIGEEAFYYCGIRNLTLPSNVQTIKNNAFGNNYINTTFYKRENGVEDKTYLAGYGNRLGDYGIYTIPSTVNKIAPYIKLNVSTIPSSITEVPTEGFMIRNVTSFTIPGTVKKIKNYGFEFIGVDTTITLSEGVEYLDKDCINANYHRFTLNIPSTVTFIHPEAFKDQGSYVDKIRINKPENKSMYGYPWGLREDQIEWIG